MRRRREDSVALKFGDTITALIDTLNISTGKFCERFALAPAELKAVQAGDPVGADLALRLAAALSWTPGDIDEFLEQSWSGCLEKWCEDCPSAQGG